MQIKFSSEIFSFNSIKQKNFLHDNTIGKLND